ncbi:response regulator with CheY-like receiver [Rheinheimera sp. A13L]|nr:response regulator with CheY-like receiver [Rheinheimera sp. A13L]
MVLADFIEFLQKQKMPVPAEFNQATSVLVVDDDVAYQRAIQRVLKSSGYEVLLAADGFQVGVMLLENKPSVMTLDLQMPGLDGFEVLKFIRQRPELHHIKILVISGLAQVELEKARAAGADATLAKPFDNTLLLTAIAQLLH